MVSVIVLWVAIVSVMSLIIMAETLKEFHFLNKHLFAVTSEEEMIFCPGDFENCWENDL